MKLIKENKKENGTTRVIVDLEPNEKMVVINVNSHYRLGYPVEDVLAPHVIEEAVQVTWCSASQQWVE